MRRGETAEGASRERGRRRGRARTRRGEEARERAAVRAGSAAAEQDEPGERGCETDYQRGERGRGHYYSDDEMERMLGDCRARRARRGEEEGRRGRRDERATFSGEEGIGARCERSSRSGAVVCACRAGSAAVEDERDGGGEDAPALIEMYSCERSQVQYVAVSSPSPSSMTISMSSAARSSLARCSSTISGSPATRSRSGCEPSWATNETETLVGSISNGGCE